MSMHTINLNLSNDRLNSEWTDDNEYDETTASLTSSILSIVNSTIMNTSLASLNSSLSNISIITNNTSSASSFDDLSSIEEDV